MASHFTRGYEIFNGGFSWDKMGVFIDTIGSLNSKNLYGKGWTIYFRITGPEDKIKEIANFIKAGSITRGTHPTQGSRVFEINVREELLYLLINCRPYCKLRSDMIRFLLDTYNFKANASNNLNFDNNKFQKLIEIWNLKVKEKRLLSKKEMIKTIEDKGLTGEQLTEEEQCVLNGEEELEGGEEDE